MSRKAYLLSAAVLAGLAVAAFGVNAYLTGQQHLAQRHHLLCEVLRPGMSKDELLTLLKEAGEFTIAGAESPSPSAEWHVVFTDPKGRATYGAFDLDFTDDRYDAAYVRGFDSVEVICDFTNGSGTSTGTPRP